VPIPLDDRGLLLGDGLFETLLWRAGELVLGPEHHQRMTAAAAALGLPAPAWNDFQERALGAVREAALLPARAAVRVTLTAGSGGRGLDRPAALAPRLFATAAPAIRPESSARLIVSSVRRNPASPASRFKTLSYVDSVAARREATLAGADEAVMLNVAGCVASAAAANVFWIKGEALFTPPPDAGALAGILAAQVRAAAERLGVETQEVYADLATLQSADTVFLTNSLIGVRPAHWLGAPAPAHPLAGRIAEAVDRFV
jgi:branched-chain amino acid aminotransferase/4-amino-4-deoxychorismate lyase